MTSDESIPGAWPEQRWRRQTLLLVAVLPFLILALLNLRAPIDLSLGDQAQYVLHARSILAGRAYTDDGYIYTSHVIISPKAYPPGLPLVIAAVEGVGAPLIVLRLLMIASVVLFLYVAGRYLATLDDPLLGPASILMCAFIPNLALYATGLYSDFGFAAAAWGCCLLADRPGEWSRGRIAALAVLGAVAIAFRTAAVALIPALVVHQAWRTWRYKEPWTRAIVPLVAWIGVYFTIDMLLPVTQSYAQQITTGATHDAPRAGRLGLIELLPRRAMGYRGILSAIQLTPTRWPLANAAYHAAAFGALAIGAIVWVRRAGVRFLFCFTVFYVGVLLLMPWAIARFIWPLAPVIWFATLDGARTVFQAVKIDRARASKTAAVLAASVAIAALVLGPKAPPLKGMGDLPEGRALYAALAHEAASTPVRAMTSNPRGVALLRGVSAMSIPRLLPDPLLAEADSFRITHAVLGSVSDDSSGNKPLRNALAKYPERFQRVYGNERFTLYKLVPAPTRQ